jgi:type IV secretion system protein TrbG
MAVKTASVWFGFFLAVGLPACAQEKKDDPPPIIVKRAPPVRKDTIPAPDKYPLAEAVRTLQSGDAAEPPAAAAPTLPPLRNEAASGKSSSEVPRDFQPKRDLALNATGADALLISRDWEEAHNAPTVGNDGRVVYTYGAGLPILVCAPLHVCMLELERGEKLIGEPHIGDSIRWEISPTVSGSGTDATPILIIKPRISGLDTTMVIPTDRRAYYVRLESKPSEYVARVAFAYPEDRREEWLLYLAKQQERELQEKAQAERVANLPNTAIEDLYWNYEIKGGTPETRPVHVMDDGAQTYIQMPEGAVHRELPVLVVKGTNGSEMVNYRVKDNIYIVDRLFERAALLLGTGKHQTKIELVRKSQTKNMKTEPVKLPPSEPPANSGEGRK